MPRKASCACGTCVKCKLRICEQQGPECDGQIEGHHIDYERPLEVRWLCKRHHDRITFNQRGHRSMSPTTTRRSNTATKHSAAPERSLTQRLDALERANEVRTKRAELKRNLKGGRESIHALLMDPPSYIETAKLFDMLLAVPKYGRVKVNKTLTQCRISPSKTLGGLSQRQRDEVVSLLRR